MPQSARDVEALLNVILIHVGRTAARQMLAELVRTKIADKNADVRAVFVAAREKLDERCSPIGGAVNARQPGPMLMRQTLEEIAGMSAARAVEDAPRVAAETLGWTWDASQRIYVDVVRTRDGA